MACSHYSNNCLVKFECCKKLYPCRLCHDKAESHKANRYEINQMMCMGCSLLQQKAHSCIQCFVEVSKYFCPKCNLWDSSDSQIFHCNKCNVCRRGDPKTSFHCDACHTCLVATGSKNHTHVENTTSGNCPICAEDMLGSVEILVLLRCGHSLHERCFNEFIRETYTCPICSKPIGDTSTINKKVEHLLEMEPFYPGKEAKNIAKCSNCNNLSSCKSTWDKCPFCGFHGIVSTTSQETCKKL
ncbi:zinc finger domain-containing protein [Encephalitozoon hellem ATCC 50504]|uniref:CHY zinc finger domain-containing protein n=1 Tax=Encephalitozoon hellem TaxID=27973 RepID=A0A9Q9C518_ENCHE|nr:zinc finger domain-containing protein [Encephalitozoon hellem ATCC 50504]AFM99293.1 zinc finger domain-containing protein [Encephalitozoon hellem ATCC 50504]UTX44296.1 CHY zinc finger domain-containing protein [Encephalitozoon hellem]WEL39795.1 CHY zinc finger domain-containing protein [Encephalitozoon hellem]|eukprot:XP_003888274.1 zinc finger domain-containing protein [Encephalitozoon hellem ATCC 50504]